MNELIVKLYEECDNSMSMSYSDFKRSIETACQAQRNSCIRCIRDEYLKSDHINLIGTVLTAEIEKQDYV